MDVDEPVSLADLEILADEIWTDFLRGYVGPEADGIANSLLRCLYTQPLLHDETAVRDRWLEIIEHPGSQIPMREFFTDAAEIVVRAQFNIAHGYRIPLQYPPIGVKDDRNRRHQGTLNRLDELLGSLRYLHLLENGTSTPAGRRGMKKLFEDQPTRTLFRRLGRLFGECEQLSGSSHPNPQPTSPDVMVNSADYFVQRGLTVLTDEHAFSARVAAVTDSVLQHEGYGPAQIAAAKTTTHGAAGCEFDSNSLTWVCSDEWDRSNHPVLDELNIVAELVRLTLEENSRLDTI